ncbi:MAG: hypothetical protein BRC43_03535 [Cyanobacteria bacterium QS_3_48_167]|nr:MAG: hypothetical protein BRC43_03535 [Cyanobacteria bacterium QS_3_48_167]
MNALEQLQSTYLSLLFSITIETWLQDCLLPLVKPGQIIVMDNAPFHNSQIIPKLMENAGCELWYLPQYFRLFQYRGGKKLRLQFEKSYLNTTFMFIEPPMRFFRSCKYFVAHCCILASFGRNLSIFLKVCQ